MFESSPFMSLDKKDDVILIGPKSEIVTILNSKISLYEIFSNIVPMANYSITHSYDELIQSSKKLMKKTGNPLFVSLELSAAGGK